jgi:hypothetical protein
MIHYACLVFSTLCIQLALILADTELRGTSSTIDNETSMAADRQAFMMMMMMMMASGLQLKERVPSK